MSLIGSLLAFVLIPLKAKRRELAAGRPKEVENLAVLAMADELRRTTFALDYWRATGLALIEENERLKRQRDSLAAELRRYQRRYEAPQQAMATQAMMAQQAQLQQQSYQGLGSLLAEEQARYEQMAWGDCTCVPARSHALGVHPAEPLPR